MKKFYVQQNELHVSEYVVEAESANEAAQKVLDGEVFKRVEVRIFNFVMKRI